MVQNKPLSGIEKYGYTPSLGSLSRNERGPRSIDWRASWKISGLPPVPLLFLQTATVLGVKNALLATMTNTGASLHLLER